MAQQRPNRTLGPAHDEFWAWCNKGEFRLQRCESCGNLTWPAAAICDNCGGDALSWEPMSGRGRIVSWCSFERDYHNGLLPIPWDTILVELAEGPLFISNPQDFTAADIYLNMSVKLTFLECEDEAGRFRLPVFERLGSYYEEHALSISGA